MQHGAEVGRLVSQSSSRVEAYGRSFVSTSSSAPSTSNPHILHSMVVRITRGNHLERNLPAAFNQGLSQTPTTMESARTAGCRPRSTPDGSSSSCPSLFRGPFDAHSTQTGSSKSTSRSSVGTVPTFLGVCTEERPTQTAELEGAQRRVGWNVFVTKWQSECTTQVQHLRQVVAQSQLEAKLRSPAPKRSASGLHDATPELEGWLFRKHCEPPGSPGIRRQQHSV